MAHFTFHSMHVFIDIVERIERISKWVKITTSKHGTKVSHSWETKELIL